MSINNIIPKSNEILKDENELWYFTKSQKTKILNYLTDCSIEDLKFVSEMGENYLIPTWYYFLNDYEISKKLIEKENFKILLNSKPEDYKIPEDKTINKYGFPKQTLIHLNTTIYFTPNNEILVLLKNQGFKFIENTLTIDNFYRTYEIIKAGIIEFNENNLIENIYFKDNYESIIEKILSSYNTKKNSTNDLIEMSKAINGFVELGCKTQIKYKSLINAKDYFISEEKDYKTIIKEYCPDLDNVMEKIKFIEKMNTLGNVKNSKKKI